jgi:hypothetical protein
LDSEIIKLKKELNKNSNQREHKKYRYYIDSCSLLHFDSSTLNKVKQFVSKYPNTFSIRSRSQIDGVDTVFGNVLFIGYNDHFFKNRLSNIQFTELVYFNGRYSSGTLWLYILGKNSDSTFRIIKNQFGGYLD